MNSLFSSFKISVPGYKGVGGKRAVSLGEWILPAFGIPSRNPAIANNDSGIGSCPGRNRQTMEIFLAEYNLRSSRPVTHPNPDIFSMLFGNDPDFFSAFSTV
jgi:hypothetical protein